MEILFVSNYNVSDVRNYSALGYFYLHVLKQKSNEVIVLDDVKSRFYWDIN